MSGPVSATRGLRLSLEGRTALVTGASSGLGRHFTRTLAEAGATVIAAARRIDRLDERVRGLRGEDLAAHAVAMDVTDAASVASAFDVVAALGLTADVVVNNAGVAATAPLLDPSDANWDAALDTNLKGAWTVAREAARRLIAARRPGAIVNVASITGLRPAGGVAPYAVSKAGLIHLTKAMALELARHHIRVNALAPGYVKTELNREFLASEPGERLRTRIPQRRFGVPEDLDGPLLLLASSAGDFITGSVLAVDGGHLVSGL